MKLLRKSSPIALVLIAFVSFSSFTIGNTEIAEIKTSAVCGSCESTIKTALFKLSGIKSVALNIETAVVTVKYDPEKVTLDNIRLAISKAGYDADDVLADEKAYENLHSCCKKDAVH